MFGGIWHDYLYQPLLNGLIWLYNNWADENLGWAIVYLTVLLRLALLPFTLISEYNNAKNEDMVDEVKRIDKEYGKDEVLKKEEIRRLLKKRRVQPWAKAVSLGVQGLVLILLYQVFISGIEGRNLFKLLYDWVDHPGVINTMFYGFDLGERHTYLWPGIVTVLLFIEIFIESHREKLSFQKTDLAYFFLFPLAVFIGLWWLPMVKSLFILTSMVFSLIIGVITRPLFRVKKPEAAHGAAAHH